MPMTDFVLEQLIIKQSTSEFKEVVKNYANFLIQPLTLGMFVPVDSLGNVLAKPTHYDEWLSEYEKGYVHGYEQAIMGEYLEAKEKVLFEGFEIKVSKIHENREFIGWEIYNSSIFINIGNGWQKPEYPDYHIIEDLIKSNEAIELTPSALKQIVL